MPAEVFYTFGWHVVDAYYVISTNRNLLLLPIRLRKSRMFTFM